MTQADSESEPDPFWVETVNRGVIVAVGVCHDIEDSAMTLWSESHYCFLLDDKFDQTHWRNADHERRRLYGHFKLWLHCELFWYVATMHQQG